MRKPLKVQQVVHFFPLPPSSASTAAVSVRAELHTALPIPTSSRRCSASDLPALPAKNQYTEPKFPNFQICCWPLCYDFNGFGVRTLKSSPFFTFHPPIYHLPFQVWPLHAQILLKSSFHPFLLFTFAQNHCPEPPLYFSLVSSFPSLYRKLQCKGSALPRLISQRPVQKAHSSLPFPLITRTQIHCGFAGTRELRVLVNIPCCLLEFGCMSPALSKGEM